MHITKSLYPFCLLTLVAACATSGEAVKDDYTRYFGEPIELDVQPSLVSGCAAPEEAPLEHQETGELYGDIDVDGTALVGLTVGQSGEIKGIKIYDSSADDDGRVSYRFIRKCLRQVELHPAQVNGQSVEVENYPVRIKFVDGEVPEFTLGFPEADSE
ncbi:energy transducer TonB [Parvularcula marina]|uniref:energy transducer TonB n=1 Tax=Parvularcula marina TaxID=2292771 RepID=UPI003512431D